MATGDHTMQLTRTFFSLDLTSLFLLVTLGISRGKIGCNPHARLGSQIGRGQLKNLNNVLGIATSSLLSKLGSGK